jgi:hypothetical protein
MRWYDIRAILLLALCYAWAIWFFGGIYGQGPDTNFHEAGVQNLIEHWERFTGWL